MKSASIKIPASLAPYFQEHDFKKLDLEKDVYLIIERTLEYGNRKELGWLFKTYRTERIKGFLREHGFRALSRRSFNFWRVILKVHNYQRPSWLTSKSPIWRF